MSGPPRKVRAPDLTPMKARGERIVMFTAYDTTMARLLDRAGIDVLLVGDSLGQVILGLDTTRLGWRFFSSFDDSFTPRFNGRTSWKAHCSGTVSSSHSLSRTTTCS